MKTRRKWNIEITEVLQKTVTHKAMTEQEAISAVKELYNREEIILDADCVVERKFERVNTDELERMSCTQWGHDKETDNIENLINNREKTYHGIYSDIGEALKDVSDKDLIDYYSNKFGTSELRNLCEELIIKAEINREKYCIKKELELER